MVLASCILHNILRDKRSGTYQLPEHDPSVPQGDWRRDPLDELQLSQRQTGPAAAKIFRTHLTNCYSRPENLLPWQKI